MKEFLDYDALGLADLVRSGKVSARELLNAAIQRAEQVNDQINAVVTPMYDQAQGCIEAGVPDGPFAGVPFLLKDLRVQYAGVPTTAGSRFMRDNIPDRDSELVARYKRAGLVIFGKTNTPEFGSCPSTEGALFGPTRNPWGLDFSAGGSSGGAAAAVAARILPAAHGSDGGGSIRIPAACCGIFGFKPTRGINPAGPYYGEPWNGLSAEHVLTLSVRDSAAMLDVSGGAEPGNPHYGPVSNEPYLTLAGRPPGRLKIAVQREALSGTPVHTDCLVAVDETVKLLEDLGHHVEEATPSYDVAGIGAAFPLIIAASVQATIDQRVEETGVEPSEEMIEPVIRLLAQMGHQRNASDMVRAIWSMRRAGQQIKPFFERYDALLSPVVATPPPPLGTLNTDSPDVDAYLQAVFAFIPFTALANITGTPAMSVPMTLNEDGLPIGSHFLAGFGRDGMLFQLAAQLEEAKPWMESKPTVCASH